MKISPYTLILSSLVLFSCKKEEEVSSVNNKNVAVPFTQMPTNTPTTTASPPSQSVYTAKDEQQQSVMYQYKYDMVKNPNTSTSSPTVTAPGMNPPHGHPKHRCDIPVGTSLNSPAPKTTPSPKTTVVTTTPNATTSNNAVPTLLATSPETTPTLEGMNPPHGQPKHRCDIAVGAPLPKE